MTIKKRVALVVYSILAAAVGLVLLAFLAVQAQQWTIRWHAERLSADMHVIRLYQTTWADAQRSMHRWGAWGHYDGSCTAADCKYDIEMNSIASFYPMGVPRHVWLDWLLMHDRLNLYQWFGGRTSVSHATFTLHDGTIWREGAWMGVSVPGRRMHRITGPNDELTGDDFDLTLSIGAGSYQRLHRSDEDPFLYMGAEDTLTGHPYYKVGRPGGCKINCEMGVVYYSTHTPPAEIERMTSYDFSCFTRFHPCKEIEDLLPAAKEWHLYKEDQVQQSSLPEKLCDVPVWALARDARYVLAIEALSTETKNRNFLREVARVRILQSLKEPSPWPPGAIVSADIGKWLSDSSPFNEDQHLVPGKKYLVFPIGNDRSRDRLETENAPLTFERCGVQEDTPQKRHELEQGFAQNDTLSP